MEERYTGQCKRIVVVVTVVAKLIQPELVLHVTVGLVQFALDAVAMQMLRKIVEDVMVTASYMYQNRCNGNRKIINKEVYYEKSLNNNRICYYF